MPDQEKVTLVDVLREELSIPESVSDIAIASRFVAWSTYPSLVIIDKENNDA